MSSRENEYIDKHPLSGHIGKESNKLHTWLNPTTQIVLYKVSIFHMDQKSKMDTNTGQSLI
jgi:hypothetical protein